METLNLKDDGYRGIWYFCNHVPPPLVYKYSGGLGTYPQQIHPMAHYCEKAGKTFFVYGGVSKAEEPSLLHMVSYYDHATGRVPRPTVLIDKKTADGHDNPSLSVDGEGYLWVFSNAHGTSRPSHVHRSVRPHDIDEFEHVLTTNFSYAQPWHIPGKGFLVLHSRYSHACYRRLFWMTSPDGVTWSEPQPLAAMVRGHYQVSLHDGAGRVGTAFNHHLYPRGPDFRTNLYYLETRDMGGTWQTADGEAARAPLTSPRTPALVRDYESEGLFCYLKQISYDAAGRPVILHLVSRGYEPGPGNEPRTWRTARWTGSEWEFRDVTNSDNNYDYGSFYIEADGTWRIIGPSDNGPQQWNPGGEMVMWTSADEGASWLRAKQLTDGSEFNHTYARRPVNAHPDFYAFWADGHGRQPSESRLYFTSREGDRVRRLPPVMEGDFAEPEPV